MAKSSKIQTINEEQLVDRMRYENPWWLQGSIDPYFDTMNPRAYFRLFLPLVLETNIKRAVVLMGPRRVGKTVMMQHSVQYLLSNGQQKEKICFISVDNPIYINRGLDELFMLARAAAGSLDPKGWFVFIDEIQYLQDWELHLKILVDSYPYSKFIVSGSAAAALKLKSRESGAGRFTEFLLPALTFYEYVELKGLQGLIKPSDISGEGTTNALFSSNNINELNRHFLEYINFGGYPEMLFSEGVRAATGRYIKSDIIDKVLLRDLPGLYGIQDVQELNAFFTTLAFYSGNECSLDSLSKSSGVQKNLLKKYLEYLEAAFLIKIVDRIDDSAKKFQRATFYKIYLTNPSLRTALFSPIRLTDDQIGNMVETGMLSQWLHDGSFKPWYARWNAGRQQGEVDVVGLDRSTLKPEWALEIKWSNRYTERPEELKSLFQFCSKNKLTTATVTTISKEVQEVLDGVAITFIPAALYAYAIGYATMQ